MAFTDKEDGMCGIAGFCNLKGDWRANIAKMNERMHHGDRMQRAFLPPGTSGWYWAINAFPSWTCRSTGRSLWNPIAAGM